MYLFFFQALHLDLLIQLLWSPQVHSPAFIQVTLLRNHFWPFQFLIVLCILCTSQ